MSKTFKIICAVDRNGGIGFKNQLPWPKIKEDMKYFREITTKTTDQNKQNAVIMGGKTYESIGRYLPDRINFIVSKIYNQPLDHTLDVCHRTEQIENIFVIGGEQLFTEAIQRLDCSEIYVTRIDKEYECDRYFPKIPSWFSLLSSRSENDLTFEVYKNIADPTSDEKQYLSLLKEIIETGEDKDGRNGKTLSIFGPQHVFDLQKGFPLLTTKKMFFSGIVKELLFFLKGQTDSNILSNQGVKIWEGNTTREFLDKRGLTNYKVGDIGPMYGYNWRHFGHKYEGCENNYENQGYDQLYHLIDSLIRDRNSRRHLLTTYNPAVVSESVLAPCHGIAIQFNVRANDELDCKMFQRSVDCALGYPFNIASYALLVHIICHVTGYKPGKLIMTLGDTHLYKEHIDQVSKQIDRVPMIKPSVKIDKIFEGETTEERIKFIEDLVYNDILLENYSHWPGIKMDMVV